MGGEITRNNAIGRKEVGSARARRQFRPPRGRCWTRGDLERTDALFDCGAAVFMLVARRHRLRVFGFLGYDERQCRTDDSGGLVAAGAGTETWTWICSH